MRYFIVILLPLILISQTVLSQSKTDSISRMKFYLTYDLMACQKYYNGIIRSEDTTGNYESAQTGKIFLKYANIQLQRLNRIKAISPEIASTIQLLLLEYKLCYEDPKFIETDNTKIATIDDWYIKVILPGLW